MKDKNNCGKNKQVRLIDVIRSKVAKDKNSSVASGTNFAPSDKIVDRNDTPNFPDKGSSEDVPFYNQGV